MITLELTEDEARMLRDLLEGDLPDLQIETFHTHDSDAREGMKKLRSFVMDLIHRLETPVEAR